jgi:endogenous inhibitor of DNA gyrase (YacG/DUF329 family)
MENCYKCNKELDRDPVDEVHPLCDFCQNDFDDWLQNEMMGL